MSARTVERFRDCTAIVTGGGSGIGAALTTALVAAGAVVWCTDIDADAALRVSTAATGPGSAQARGLDVTDAAAVQALVDEVVDRSGRLDFMFNNAGIVIGGQTHLLTLQQWDQILDVNIRGVVHGVHAAYPHMIAAGSGHIINTASAAGLMASGLLTSYCTTKFAVVGLSNALRSEAVRHGVGVTVVCPSAVETPILDKGAVGTFPGRDFFLGAERTKKAYPPERLASEILAAVAQNKPWLVVPRRTRIGWALCRMLPALAQRRLTDYVQRQPV